MVKNGPNFVYIDIEWPLTPIPHFDNLNCVNSHPHVCNLGKVRMFCVLYSLKPFIHHEEMKFSRRRLKQEKTRSDPRSSEKLI